MQPTSTSATVIATYAAYEAVKRHLSRLVGLGELRLAMELSLELMAQGSYQVEASDEGLMTDDIEECLKVVIQAVGHCDLPASESIAWCRDMLQKDRVGFICEEKLKSLRHDLEASRST